MSACARTNERRLACVINVGDKNRETEEQRSTAVGWVGSSSAMVTFSVMEDECEGIEIRASVYLSQSSCMSLKRGMTGWMGVSEVVSDERRG